MGSGRECTYVLDLDYYSGKLLLFYDVLINVRCKEAAFISCSTTRDAVVGGAGGMSQKAKNIDR